MVWKFTERMDVKKNILDRDCSESKPLQPLLYSMIFFSSQVKFKVPAEGHCARVRRTAGRDFHIHIYTSNQVSAPDYWRWLYGPVYCICGRKTWIMQSLSPGGDLCWTGTRWLDNGSTETWPQGDDKAIKNRCYDHLVVRSPLVISQHIPAWNCRDALIKRWASFNFILDGVTQT